MKLGDTATIHTHVCGNHRGTLHSFGRAYIVLRDAVDHHGYTHGQVSIAMTEVKAITINAISVHPRS